MSRRFCVALDLKDDPALIAEYRLEIKGLGESRQRVVNFSEQRYSKTV
jgi:hypothetical protein